MLGDSIRVILLGGLALSASVAVWFLFRWAPKTLMVAWAIVLFLVPIWIGVQAGVFYSAITIITLLAVAASSMRQLRYSVVDLLVVVFAALLTGAWLLGWVLWGHLIIVLIGWLVPYVWGRLAVGRINLQWIYSCLAVGAVVASLLAIVEFVTGVNLFVSIGSNNSLYTTWSPLQYRGGLLRVEGAFGHSIALGACLAMCSIFFLVVRWPLWVRVGSLALVVVATALTFSRIGLIGMVITLGLGLLFLGREVTRATRITVTTLMAVGAVVGLPLIFAVFSEAGQEASGSAEYRSDLFSLFHDMMPLGVTPSWTVLPNGVTYYGTFQSIDSELVLAGLRFGLLPLLLLIALLVICLFTVLRGKATPAAIAIVGQIPAFATVALITQYASLVWFMAGLAVASYNLTRPNSQADVARDIVPVRLREEQACLS